MAEYAELAAFLILACASYVALRTRAHMAVITCFFVYVVYSIIVRSAPPEADMVVYYETAVSAPSWKFYYFREPILWYGSNILYRLTGDVVTAFVVIDIIVGVLVLWAMHSLDCGDGRMYALAPTILSSFVFLLGQQNILRQHLALVLLLCAIGLRSRSVVGGALLMLFSGLSHNVSTVLSGYWIDCSDEKGRRLGRVLTMGATIGIFVLWSVVRRAAADTGMDTRHLYLAVFLLLAGMITYARLGRLEVYDHRSSAIVNFFIISPTLFVLSSAQFERIAMIYYLLALIEVYRYADAIGIRRVEIMNMVYVALVVPIFVFPNALAKLL